MAGRIGQQIGNYRLTRLLGIGSFAEVYLGLHIHLGTEAAIKLLHAQLALPAEVEKFRQEAQTIAALKHPSIVRVLDFGIEQGAPYLVMDYAPNGSLRQRVARGQPAAPATIAPYVQQVAEALQHAHDQKLVHRDIKPENMLLGQRHEVLLSDFGIAVALQQTRTHLTVHGFSGTAVYAAPEQFKGQVGPASDQYALAVVVYEWLTDERPFQGDDIIAIGMAKIQQPPPSLCEKLPTLSPALEQVVQTALATDPRERFANVRAFANAFVQAAQSATPSPFVISPSAPAPSPQTPLPETIRVIQPPQQDSAAPTQMQIAAPGPDAPLRKRRPGMIALVSLLLAAVVLASGLAAFGVIAGKGPLAFLNPGSRPTATATLTLTPSPTLTPTFAAPDDFTYYVSPDGAFAIAYPIGWQQKPAPTGDGIEFDGPGPKGETYYITNLGPSPSYDPNGPPTQPALTQPVNTFCRNFGGVLSNSLFSVPLAEHWLAQSCNNGSVGQAVVETAVHVTGNRDLYEIAFSALWPHLGEPDVKTHFQTMTLSLRFLDTHNG